MAFFKTFAVFVLAKMLSLVDAMKRSTTTTMLRSTGNPLPRMLAFETVETVETVYAEEAQAWRMLGLYMDCEAQEDGTTVCERFLLWAAVSQFLRTNHRVMKLEYSITLLTTVSSF